MKIFVFGWYDHNNLGDESYKLSFKTVWPQHSFTFSDSVKEEDRELYDLCIIGGGDVLRERSLLAINRLNCPKIGLSVTVTKQSLCKEIYDLEYIYVRDEKSLQTLSNFGYLKSEYIPDISIILKGDKAKGRELIQSFFRDSNLELYNNVYSIVVNSHLLGSLQSELKNKIIFDKVVSDIAELIDSTSASFIFIPFSTRFPWDDRVTNGLVNSFTKFNRKNCVIFDSVNVQDSINIISASNLLLTTRFHGLVFGIGNSIPTITISFHDKISGFCETINQEYLDYYNLSLNQLQGQIKNIKVNKNINPEQIKNDYIEKVYLLRGE